MEKVYLDMVKSDMKRINVVPSKNKKKKTIQWILDDDVIDILPKPFIKSLMHGVWQPLSDESKKKLSKYSKNRSQSYKKADELTVVSLHPYQAYFRGSTNENKSYPSIIGLDETQNIISDAFNHDSLPFEKIMDKLTNACFQDHASTRLSRRIDEPLQNQITGSANIPQIQEATETNNQGELATSTNNNQRKSPRTRESARTNTNFLTYNHHVPITSLPNRGREEHQKSVKVAKKKSGYRAEVDQLDYPRTINLCDYFFPISVDPDR